MVMVSIITLIQQNGAKLLILFIIWTIIFIFMLNYEQKLEAVEPEYDELESFDYINDSKLNIENIVTIESEHPSIPFRYWYNHKNQTLQTSKECAEFPSITKLKYHNTNWQTFVEGITIMLLYSAYYDARPSLHTPPVVRLLGMINTKIKNKKKKRQKYYCQLWYDDSTKPSLVPVSKFNTLWSEQIWKTTLIPHLINCPLAGRNKSKVPRVPKVVSLVTSKCGTATNSLRVHYDVPDEQNSTKYQFAVCVKGVQYSHKDISAHLIEWLELQFILGASKIYFYVYQLELHPNVTKVLEYYKQRGLVDIRPFTFADGIPNVKNLQYFLLNAGHAAKALYDEIAYHDCFYRNLYRHDYIALQNIDEVLMPLGNLTNWYDLMAIGRQQHTAKCSEGYASFCFLNVHFSNRNGSYTSRDATKEVSGFMNMLQYKPIKIDVKCFYRTSQIITIDIYSKPSLKNMCPSYHFSTDIAQMQHYRERLVFEDTANDMNSLRFKGQLQQRLQDVLRKIGFKFFYFLNNLFIRGHE